MKFSSEIEQTILFCEFFKTQLEKLKKLANFFKLHSVTTASRRIPGHIREFNWV